MKYIREGINGRWHLSISLVDLYVIYHTFYTAGDAQVPPRLVKLADISRMKKTLVVYRLSCFLLVIQVTHEDVASRKADLGWNNMDTFD